MVDSNKVNKGEINEVRIEWTLKVTDDSFAIS